MLTESLSALPALNLGCFEALICIASPVRGLRPVVALRCATEKVPKPTRRTSFPLCKDPVILLKTLSTAFVASAFEMPTTVFWFYGSWLDG